MGAEGAKVTPEAFPGSNRFIVEARDKRRIYMDHAATTPLDARVLEVMVPYLGGDFGNPSSVHQRGRVARNAVEEARERVAALLSADPSEIIFTSGGTEANNLAILGSSSRPGSVFTTRAEHEAVLRPVEYLAQGGADVRWLDVDRSARLSSAGVEAVGGSSSGDLVTVMHVNNETGAISDVAAVGETCRATGAVFHCDAVQACAYLDVDVASAGVDLLTVSSHKLYGPKGVGCLFARGGHKIEPLLRGGGQERDRRGGTENVAGIVGFARALDLAVSERRQRIDSVASLRDRLRTLLEEALGDAVTFVTDPMSSAPHILTLVVPPVDDRPLDGEMLLLNLDVEGLEVSSGSACSSGSVNPSHALSAAGWSDAETKAAVRFSLGKDNTPEEVDRAVDIFARVVTRMARQRT